MGTDAAVSKRTVWITWAVIVVLIAILAFLSVTLIRDSRNDRLARLEQQCRDRMANIVVEKPPKLPDPVSGDTKLLASQIGKNATRLWGPLIKPPPPPPPPPPKKPDLAAMSSGLKVKGIIGDPSSANTVKFIVTDKGKQQIVGAGDKLRGFKVKGPGKGGMILEYKGDTIAVPVPGL